MLVFWTRLFPRHPLQVSRISDIMAALRLHSGSGSLGLPQMVLKHQAAGARTFFASPSRGKQRLVILGSGWGGYEILRAIDKKRWSKYDMQASQRQDQVHRVANTYCSPISMNVLTRVCMHGRTLT